ncbi:hypothetical protein BOTBODRAFT_30999 [Botryobasidium botryosum FD-172 SS1]|uniref:Zinc-ribbon 15 domain-containing protein n=1 Tax=Botryobasidium botryosum (strain FD-172 SS1) TaxID=930990 RepID=A0A067ML73_BOTB1|nr:hypothetical protein BOTBODRAFT_30999 [Botryobasidium botryosum FD-172 SS1]
MDFFCLPLIFGCSDQLSPDNDGSGSRLCPRCNNAAVFAAKKKMMFELCCVPLVPMSSSRVWHCGICNWETKQGDGFEPAMPGYGGGGPQWQQPQWQPNPSPQGYPPQPSAAPQQSYGYGPQK